MALSLNALLIVGAFPLISFLLTGIATSGGGFILKNATSDSQKPWFKVGDYKMVENEVGGIDTTKPIEVKDKIRELLDEVYDIERLTGKVTNGNLNGRDLIQLKNTLNQLKIELLHSKNLKQ